jgi:hypothetical protein
MYSTTSAFRVRTYEEETGRRADACFPSNDDHDRNDRDQVNIFPFNNSVDYGLALWFQTIGCTKGDVTSFFKNEQLEPFRTGLEQLKSFRTGLSFKNGEEWLRQLDQIQTGVQDDEWLEQELIVKNEKDEDLAANMIVQYRDIKKSIGFLLGHSPFAPDLVYAPIRQYNDDNSRIYSEMLSEDRNVD